MAQDRNAIHHEVMGKVPGLIETGGYIPAIDHSIPPDVSWENYCYYIELLKEIFV